MTTVTDGDGLVTSYTFDGMRRPVTMDYPNGWKEYLSYDEMGRLVKTEDIDPKNINLKSPKFTYEYDPEGNLLHEYKRGNGQGIVNADKRYTYDALNRMTSATDPYGNQDRRYQYDSLGNLTYEQTGNNKGQDFKYNNLNQLVSKKVDNQWDYAYAYDQRGNLVKEDYYQNKNKEEKPRPAYTNARSSIFSAVDQIYTFEKEGYINSETRQKAVRYLCC